MTTLHAALESQSSRYEDFYRRWRDVRTLLRFDVRYRCRRAHEVLRSLDVDTQNKRVLDVGFGWGDLLASFPSSCHVTGADISPSAVQAAREDPRFDRFAGCRFVTLREDRPEDLPAEPFDVIVCSHVLEHVPDDGALLDAMRERLAVGGVLVVFVPVEEPDYNLLHVRNYSVQSIAERVSHTGLALLHTEGSLYVNGHVWKLVTIPSRRRWPGVRYLASGLRLGTLSLLPYRALLRMDRALFRLGFGARQALVVARREGPPLHHLSGESRAPGGSHHAAAR